jgi:hypothetical protein
VAVGSGPIGGGLLNLIGESRVAFAGGVVLAVIIIGLIALLLLGLDRCRGQRCKTPRQVPDRCHVPRMTVRPADRIRNRHGIRGNDRDLLAQWRLPTSAARSTSDRPLV